MKQTGETAAEPLQPDAKRIGYIGKTLGRFMIRSELGRGGMATVYRAHDPQLGRDVAVKVMHGFFAGRDDLEARFRREANAVAGIRHPCILALYDFAPPNGEEPGYLVSELIEGRDLRHLLDSCGGRLLPEIAALIGAHVADALGAAHAAGVVHRDVKPDNVLLDRAGGGARVVLSDFGVAHVTGLDTMTATGAVLGSPAYMSPEQARGNDVGPPSDVFSLGVLLYQLCTGHFPFSGKDPLTVLSAILRGEFVRPAKLESRIGPELERIILRCLAREAADRYAGGAEAARALRDWLKEADLGDETATLRRFLDAPDAFVDEQSPRISQMAVAAAQVARQKRQGARALAELDRALAYDPSNAQAQLLLNQLSHGARRIPRAVLAIVALGASIAIAATTYRLTRARPTPTRPSPITAAAPPGPAPVTAAPAILTPTRGPLPSSTPEPVVHLPDTGGEIPAPVSHAQRTASKAAPPRPKRAVQFPPPGSAEPATTALAARPFAATEVPSPASMGSAAPATVGARDSKEGGNHVGNDGDARVASGAPTAQLGAGATAGVILRASHGFCEPSLDDGPPSLRASYSGLAPGPHEIYCTLPQGGPKVHVATFPLRAGSQPSLIIVRGADGHPALARPE